MALGKVRGSAFNPSFQQKQQKKHRVLGIGAQNTGAQLPEAEKEEQEQEQEEKSTNGTTVCILSGATVEGPEREDEEMQEKVIKQLKYAQLIFPALAVSRMIDGVPGLLDPNANQLEELMVVVSAVDPLLVGIFAYGTASGLQNILDKEKGKEETLENMRKNAMESLVNFFERTNLVVFGVAFATFSRLIVDGVSGSDTWASLLNAWETAPELHEAFSGLEQWLQLFHLK